MKENTENNKKKDKTVLVIEDSLLLSQALEFGLKKAGFEVIVAPDGVEGLEKIKKYTPKIILLDVLMPNKDGFEVLEETIEFRKNEGVKTIMLTNFSEEESMDRCYSLGADDYLIKANFTIADIADKIRKIIAST